MALSPRDSAKIELFSNGKVTYVLAWAGRSEKIYCKVQKYCAENRRKITVDKTKQDFKGCGQGRGKGRVGAGEKRPSLGKGPMLLAPEFAWVGDSVIGGKSC